MLGQLNFNDGDNPRNVLEEFIEDVVRFLRMVAFNDEPNWKPIFRESLIGPMQAATEGLNYHSDRARKQIRVLGEDQIRDHGLSGNELRFKLAVINDAYGASGGIWTFPGWRRLIEAIDVLLESILAATGAGTAVSEVKDYIGLSVVDE